VVVTAVDEVELRDRHDSCERHTRELVGISNVVSVRGLESADARFVRGDVERAEIHDAGLVSRETGKRGLEPGAVAAWKVTLYEKRRHRRSTMALGSFTNNRSNLWICSSGLAVMCAARSVREVTPTFL
jgi:hypothetical protein